MCMESLSGKMGKRIAAAGAALALGILVTVINPAVSWAAETGTYLVTVSPSYTDPETGNVEDPGDNAAIGQGMTERMCGSTGLLEVDVNGDTYLTLRYYLSQFIRDVSFEERSGGSYRTLSWQRMKIKDPVDGASDVSDKYGYTDYRVKVGGIGSVLRGKAYIDAMGRDVVYFITFSNPVPGSGDFIVSLPAAETNGAAEADAGPPEEGEADVSQTAGSSGLSAGQAAADRLPETDGSGPETSAESQSEEADMLLMNGSGDADEPVTGIPRKPGAGTGAVPAAMDEPEPETYHLQTDYDLAAVPVRDARKLTAPLLEAATGITGMTGDDGYPAAAASMGSKNTGSNQMVMVVLLAVSALLMARFGLASLGQRRQAAGKMGKKDAVFESAEYLAAAAALETQYRAAAERLQQEFRERAAARMEPAPKAECGGKQNEDAG